MKAGNATDVDARPAQRHRGRRGATSRSSTRPSAATASTRSPNQGQSWFLMLGTHRQPADPGRRRRQAADPVVTPAGSTPNGATKTRILLAKPSPRPTGQPGRGPALPGLALRPRLQRRQLRRPLPDQGLRPELDQGPHRHRGRGRPGVHQPVEQRDPRRLRHRSAARASYNLSLGHRPDQPQRRLHRRQLEPQGRGTGRRRRVSSGSTPPASSTPTTPSPYSGSQPDGGLIQRNTTGGVSPIDNTKGFAPARLQRPAVHQPDPQPGQLLRQLDASSPRTSRSSTTPAPTPSGSPSASARRLDRPAPADHIVDPLTGHARLIIGDDQGVFTGVDDNGTFLRHGASARRPSRSGRRNGNLAVHPVLLRGRRSRARHDAYRQRPPGVQLYGGAQDTGAPGLRRRLQRRQPRLGRGGGDAIGVATDPTGSGTVYRFIVPANAVSDFFQVNGVGRTFGLNNVPGDPGRVGLRPASARAPTWRSASSPSTRSTATRS